MKWKLILTITIIALLTTLTTAQTEQELPARIYPAPVGYTIQFDTGEEIGQIYGIRTKTGDYIGWRAPPNTKTLWLPKITNLDTIITKTATITIRPLQQPKPQTLALRLDKQTVLLLTTTYGQIARTTYNLIYTPNKNTTKQDLLITTDEIYFYGNATKLTFITDPTRKIKVETPKTSLTTTIPQLLNLKTEACLYTFTKSERKQYSPYTGGIIISPACINQNITPIKTIDLKTVRIAVIIRANTTYGKIDYLTFATPDLNTLIQLGIITQIKTYGAHYHELIDETETDYNYYQFPDPEQPTWFYRFKKLQVQDITYKDTVTIPENAEILFTLLWKPRQKLTGTLQLKAGEIIIFKYNGETYLAHGQLDWLKYRDNFVYPQPPRYKELKTPLIIEADRPIIAVSTTADIKYGTKIEIPYKEAVTKTWFYITPTTTTPITFETTSILTHPVTLMLLAFIGLIALMIVQNKHKKTPETIKVIIDLEKPQKIELTPPSALTQVAEKHATQWGTYPDELDLAIKYRTLVKIDPLTKTTQPQIIAPPTVNTTTEKTLKKLAETLTPAFWTIKRLSPKHGIIYTKIGDYQPYYYLYLQGKEETNPVKLLYNALKQATYTRQQTPNTPLPLGLVIITDKHTHKKLQKELQLLKSLSQDKINITGYFTLKNYQPKDLTVIQNFAEKKIKTIIPLTDENTTTLIEDIVEKTLGLHMEYDKTYVKAIKQEDTIR